MRIALFTVFVSAVLLPAEHVSALCGCMFGRRPPPIRAGSAERTISGPKHSPSAAVFIVRDGIKTTLTLEATYRGPREPLSMVIPVPTTIGRADVSTLPGSLFRNLDRRTAPRVQHVFPECRRPRRRVRMAALSTDGAFGGSGGGFAEAAPAPPPPVEVVDEWAVDEYDIAVLDANQSTGLLRYLREHDLDLPDDAEPVLRRYIETDHRFVLATVDPERAHTLGDEDTMVLSPLQVRYESENLAVPVRLGTLNSPGEQELLLYVLASDGRYEVANRPSVTAPTDLRLERSAAGRVAELYGSLMDELFHQTPSAAVTEFAHTLGSRIGYNNVRRFGLSEEDRQNKTWTLTRIRHRFAKELNDDLILRRAAEPLRLQRRVGDVRAPVWAPRGQSAFHARFLVRHRRCANAAQRRQIARQYAVAESMIAADETPWPGTMLRDPVPSLGIMAGSAAPSDWPRTPRSAPAPVNTPAAQWQTAEPANAAPVEGATAAEPAVPAPSASAPSTSPPAEEAAPRATSVEGCRTASGGSACLGLLALLFVRRRRRTRRAG